MPKKFQESDIANNYCIFIANFKEDLLNKMFSEQLRHTFRYGGISGIIIFSYLMLVYFFGLMNTANINFPVIMVFVGGAIISVRKYRQQSEDGVLNFGQAFVTALMTFSFAGLAWAIYAYLLYRFLEPGWMDRFAEQMGQSQEMMERLGFPKETIEQSPTIEPTPFLIAYYHIFGAVFYGGFLSLLIAWVYKGRKNPVTKNDQ